MSGALVELVSKGVQDAYLINNEGANSLFKTVFTRHTNFSMAPKRLEFSGQPPQDNGVSSIIIKSYGDLVNYVWLEGDYLTTNLTGTIFDLYIGGQKIDSHSFEFLVYAWQQYQAESYSKSTVISSDLTSSCTSFMPLHFFFCDMQSFLPIIALQYHEVEIRILWGPHASSIQNINVYANYIYLDTKERTSMVEKPMEIIITQTQTYQFPIVDNQNAIIDLSVLNHPVKTIFFGALASAQHFTDSFTFSDAEFQVNGTQVFEKMSPVYFYIVQSFFHTNYSLINFTDSTSTASQPKNQPKYTLLYMYNFCLNTTSFRPTGTCNFSRIDNAKIILNNVSSNKTVGYVYAINYNILKIQSGMAGILFGN